MIVSALLNSNLKLSTNSRNLLVTSDGKKEEFKIPFSLKGTSAISHFTPRPAELETLEDSLLPSCVLRRRVFILHGLGGIRKTQLALEFARSHRNHFSAVFWLDGSDQDTLNENLSTVANRIRECKTGPHASDHNERESAKALAGEALEWLS
jgi:hypothetical protein